MDPIKTAKVVIASILLLLIFSLGFAAYHYHSKYIETEVSLGVAQSTIDSTVSNLTACSEGVHDLKLQADAREEDAKKAMELARTSSKANQTMAQAFLASTPKSNDLCKEALLLYSDYLSKLESIK